MKVCYLVVLLFLITMAQRTGAGNYESNLGWAQIQIVDGIKRIHSSWAGGGSPEHFEPNYRSVAACAILRQASKVLASQY